jgi:hypothetical protein
LVDEANLLIEVPPKFLKELIFAGFEGGDQFIKIFL